jgi:tripartite-type tricarboxylate transporter receptor subunit TctC
MHRGAFIGAVIALAVTAQAAQAEEPFYKGKRLTILINFAAGGPTDI